MRFSNLPTPGFVSPPTLFMPLVVWHELMGYVLACPTEVNGFGMIDRLGNDLYLENVFILEQNASAAHVEVEPEVLGAYITELVRKGEDPSRMRFQWHSHVNMEAYFSSTDLALIESYRSDWMVSLVTNKRGEFELRLDVYRPFRSWTPMPLKVAVTPPDEAVHERCRTEVQTKVSRDGGWFGRKSLVHPTREIAPAHLAGEELELWSEA